MKHDYNPLPPAKFLWSCFYVENSTLFWQNRSDVPDHVNKRFADTPAGTDDNKKIKVEIKGQRFSANRIVWKMYKGDPPKDSVIIHIDGNYKNNDIKNLAAVQFASSKQAGALIVEIEQLKTRIIELETERDNLKRQLEPPQ